MCSSNHSGLEFSSLFHSQEKTHEIAGMMVSFRDKEKGSLQQMLKILQGSEEGERSWEILPYAMVLFDFPAGTGKVSVISMEFQSCLWEGFFLKSSESGAVPKGSWGDPTSSMVKAWKKGRKTDFITLKLFIFIVFLFIEKDSSFFPFFLFSFFFFYPSCQGFPKCLILLACVWRAG